jgi:hypothetical protein
MHPALQRAIADACLRADAGPAIAEDPASFLEAHGAPREDIDAILAAPARLAVYRSLVRNTLAGTVQRMLPVTRAHLTGTRSARFDEDLVLFLDAVGPRTHYLRDVSAEYVAWAAPRWRTDPHVPGYVPDLAAHELAAFAVATASAVRGAKSPVDIALDRGVAFAESARLLRYEWAVHELPRTPAGDPRAPACRAVRLLAYRDGDHAVRWLELTPLAHAVLERLVAGDALGAAVLRACEDHETPAPAVTADVARLLADLAQRGIVLGGASGVAIPL